MNEIIAYNLGVAEALKGSSLNAFLLLTAVSLELTLSAEERAAREHLGHDTWAHWVREGYEAGIREMGR